MNNARAGGCQCGAVRYTLQGEPVAITICHCTECQRQSGSAFGMSLIMLKEQVVISGELKRFTRSSASGRPVVCAFCPECGTRIAHEATYLQGVINIKPGTLDDTSWLAPTHQGWTVSKQAWLELPQVANTYERQPL